MFTTFYPTEKSITLYSVFVYAHSTIATSIICESDEGYHKNKTCLIFSLFMLILTLTKFYVHGSVSFDSRNKI